MTGSGQFVKNEAKNSSENMLGFKGSIPAKADPAEMLDGVKTCAKLYLQLQLYHIWSLVLD